MNPGVLALLWPVVGALQLGLVLRNLERFGRALPVGAGTPRVDVLVPARDEAAVIGEAVGRALGLQGVDLRVRVGDDGSVDGTAELAHRAGEGDGRLEVVAVPAPPPGWVGKAHACHVLASGSDAEWLVFLDADTRLAPHAAAAIAAADADMVSYWPRQEMGTIAEALMMPLLAHVLLAHLPFGLAETTPDPRIAAANGQCLAIRRSCYERLGGHAAVRDAVVDDVALARACKAAGGRLVIRDAGDGATCRMYAGGAALWAGFRKNLYPAFGGAPGPFIAGWAIWVALQAMPLPVLLWAGLAGRPWIALAAITQLWIGILARLFIGSQLGHPSWSILLHPVAALGLAVLMLDSARGWAGRGVTWKGRTYGGRVAP